MAHGEYAQCPNCGKMAYGKEEIEEEFGYRYDGTKPQSWCRECRSTGNREKYDISDSSLAWRSRGCDEDYTFGYDESDLGNE